MDPTLTQQLLNLGLQKNEAQAYLALLEIGAGTVTEISKRAQMNRTTSYDILERLCLYGIVNRGAAGKKKVYTAEPPSRLNMFLENKKRQAERRLEELQNLLPGLQALFKTELKPIIKVGEGMEEMKNIYLHVLDSKSTVYSILNFKGYVESFFELGAYQSAERAKRKIKEKVLAIKSEKAEEWWEKAYKGKKKLRSFTEYRWLPLDERYSTAGEINIFDDKVTAILAKPNENIAFEIQSQTFADFLKIVFELAWERAGEKKKLSSSSKH